MELIVYLAGEIHTDWRNEVKERAKHLPITFVGPQENHDRSDDIGEIVLGPQPNAIYKDMVASSFNNLRTEVLMRKADVVIALFGDQYKQWNTAMDASAAVALQKPLILIRDEKHHHPLKELSRKAHVTCTSVEQAVQALSYILE